MIKVEPCKGCGGPLLVDRFMGVTIRCDPTPLDAHTAGRALLAALPLYRVTYLGGRPSSFGSASPAVLAGLRNEPSERPAVVVTHRCTTADTKNRQNGPVAASRTVQASKVQEAPKNPPAAPGTPSWGQSGPSSEPAPTAGTPVSDPATGPRCSGCGQPCEDGTYASIGLGDLIVWAHHVDNCGG